MEILLTGTEEWAIDATRHSLHDAGHVLHSCFDDPGSGAPCIGTGGSGACPGTRPIDVILAVRAHPLPNLTRQERSTCCPMLTGLPVVVAGSTVLNPFGSRATHLIEGYDGIEAACLESTRHHEPQLRTRT